TTSEVPYLLENVFRMLASQLRELPLGAVRMPCPVPICSVALDAALRIGLLLAPFGVAQRLRLARHRRCLALGRPHCGYPQRRHQAGDSERRPDRLSHFPPFSFRTSCRRYGRYGRRGTAWSPTPAPWQSPSRPPTSRWRRPARRSGGTD